MATIRKREGKKGISYLIQVKVKDAGSGEVLVKSITWKPQQSLTLKQAEREAVIFAGKYENDIRKMVTCSNRETDNPNITFKDFADNWLEKTKQKYSASYYVNCRDSLKTVYGYIGGYKLKDITPGIIQNCYDKLDKLEKTVITVVANADLEKVMTKKGIGYMKLRYDYCLNNSTLALAIKGHRISYKFACNMAGVLGVAVNKIFDITKTKQIYAYETIHKMKRTVRAILAFAKRQRLVSDNYAAADYITFPKRPQSVIDCIDDAEIKKFYNALINCTDIRHKTAILLLLMTGFRRGELCGLEWDDIDFKNSTIAVQRVLTVVKGYGVILKEPKTESSTRTISIPESLTNQLREYRIWYEKNKADMGDSWINTNRLFTMENGGRIYPSKINDWLDRVLQSAGMGHKTVHSLRHTNITMQIMAGIPLVTVAGRAGHARPSTTSDIYAHFIKSGDRHAAKVLDNIFQNI